MFKNELQERVRLCGRRGFEVGTLRPYACSSPGNKGHSIRRWLIITSGRRGKNEGTKYRPMMLMCRDSRVLPTCQFFVDCGGAGAAALSTYADLLSLCWSLIDLHGSEGL